MNFTAPAVCTFEAHDEFHECPSDAAAAPNALEDAVRIVQVTAQAAAPRQETLPVSVQPVQQNAQIGGIE